MALCQMLWSRVGEKNSPALFLCFFDFAVVQREFQKHSNQLVARTPRALREQVDSVQRIVSYADGKYLVPVHAARVLFCNDEFFVHPPSPLVYHSEVCAKTIC